MMNQKKAKRINEKETRFARIFVMVMAFLTWFSCNGCYVSAANYGEKAGQWILDQIFWVALVILAIVLVGCLIKKAWVAAVITGIGGGLVLVFVKTPTLLETIGSNIFSAIFG